MVDFIEEVEEQLRSDRYRSLARRFLPWFGAAVAALAIGWLGAAGYEAYQNQNVAKASVAYDKAVTSLGQGDQTGAFAAFDTLSKTGPAGYKTLSLIQQGNIRMAADKAAEAAAFYDKAAAASPSPIIADLARLKAALALMDTAPYPQVETRFKVLIGAGKPFDLQAREALALAKLTAGQTAAAKADFNALLLTLGLPDSMKTRIQSALVLIDTGEAKAAAEAVKAAASLPPPSAANVAQPPAGAAEPAASAPAEPSPSSRTAQ